MLAVKEVCLILDTPHINHLCTESVYLRSEGHKEAMLPADLLDFIRDQVQKKIRDSPSSLSNMIKTFRCQIWKLVEKYENKRFKFETCKLSHNAVDPFHINLHFDLTAAVQHDETWRSLRDPHHSLSSVLSLDTWSLSHPSLRMSLSDWICPTNCWSQDSGTSTLPHSSNRTGTLWSIIRVRRSVSCGCERPFQCDVVVLLCLIGGLCHIHYKCSCWGDREGKWGADTLTALTWQPTLSLRRIHHNTVK